MGNTLIIQTRELSYRFGNQLVLDKISLEVPQGSIYGFLGPNGAGKTTTIKILLNLLHSPEHNVFLFGRELNQNRIEILSQIGSLVEQPAIYSHLSGRENLINRAILLRLPTSRVEAVLKTVDLTDNANKKAGKYSLGMKQRLGIALALLPDPQLLILDEPTNGLDPNGIIEVRQLLQDLTKNHGKTVFVSSHLLSEVEKMATHVGIINHGKLVFQGSIGSLQSVSKTSVSIGVNDPEAAANLLQNQGFQVDIANEFIQLPYSSHSEMSEVNSLLVKQGYSVFTLMQTKNDLEQLFLNITKN